MNRVGRGTLMFAVGAVMARLLWSGGFGWFVQQRMRWPLLAATAVLLAFGVYEVLAGSVAEKRDPNEARRSAGPTVGWLLMLPIVVLVSVAPTGLGAAAASRVDSYRPTEQPAKEFLPIDTASGPADMRVFDFIDRAIWDDAKSLDGTPVRLEGLVVNDGGDSDSFKLTRFLVSCCAADGIPLQVTVHHSGHNLADDTWVIADVVWRAPESPYGEGDADDSWTVEADARAITVVPNAPNDPYESPY